MPIDDPIQNPISFSLNEWKLLELIGIGGMSEVYIAVRTVNEIRQKAAIKISSASSHSVAYSKRFIQEQRILTSLNHPSIPKLLDSGITPDGRHWFAMEYIQGQSVLEYCKNLELKQQLRVIQKIARTLAVTHAHGIIHRDIKPENLLITADMHIYVLDFGVSKWESETNPEEQGLTGTDNVPFTLGYAAPEILNNNPSSIQTDIYQLGVLAYQVFGDRPLFADKHNNNIELHNLILNKSPDKIHFTSSKIKRLGINHKQIKSINIVLQQALAKKPSERQHSMYQLAEQLDNVLHNRPVFNGYSNFNHWRTKIERNWKLLTYSLLGVIASMCLVLFFQTQQHKLEIIRRDGQAINDFVKQIITLSDPRIGGEAEKPINQMIGDALNNLGEKHKISSENKIDILLPIARKYHNNGVYKESIAILNHTEELTLENNSVVPENSNSVIWARARSLHFYGKFEESGRFYKKLIDGYHTGRDMSGAPSYATLINKYGCMQHSNGNYIAAESLIQQAIYLYKQAHPEDMNHAGLSKAYSDLADLYKDWLKYDEALVNYKKSIQLLQKLPEENAFDRQLIYDELGFLYVLLNQLDKALPLFNSVELVRSKYHTENPLLAHFRFHQAFYYAKRNNYEIAEEKINQAVKTFSENLFESHVFTLRAEMYYAEVLMHQNKSIDALYIINKTIDKMEKHNREQHPFAARIYLTAAVAEYLTNEGSKKHFMYYEKAQKLWQKNFKHFDVQQLTLNSLVNQDFWEIWQTNKYHSSISFETSDAFMDSELNQ